MSKEDGSRIDWVLADAAVDTEWFITFYHKMTDSERLQRLSDLQELLLRHIENTAVHADAEERIAEWVHTAMEQEEAA